MSCAWCPHPDAASLVSGPGQRPSIGAEPVESSLIHQRQIHVRPWLAGHTAQVVPRPGLQALEMEIKQPSGKGALNDRQFRLHHDSRSHGIRPDLTTSLSGVGWNISQRAGAPSVRMCSTRTGRAPLGTVSTCSPTTTGTSTVQTPASMHRSRSAQPMASRTEARTAPGTSGMMRSAVAGGSLRYLLLRGHEPRTGTSNCSICAFDPRAVRNIW